jgi:ATP-binding cassette subfamily C protein CydD
MGFEEAFFILLLAPEFYLPLRSLGLRFHASMTGVSAARRIYEIMEQPVPVATLPPVAGAAVSAPVINLRQAFTIEFCDVRYTYPGRELPALEDISFKIQSGQTTALVGPSGAGKSTIASLLLGFMRAEQGSLRWNGQDFAEISPDAWRSQVAWVPQAPYLFHGTVAENIRIARPGASIAELREAAEQAHLAAWIEGLPGKYESQIGESGARLSGGQAQRLALARAFLRDAPLLVMDEPTAHLDVELEHMLQESTRRLCAGRTVLVIAHRLPTVAHADHIIALDGGRIVEEGTHHELIRRGGLYARLLAAYGGYQA